MHTINPAIVAAAVSAPAVVFPTQGEPMTVEQFCMVWPDLSCVVSSDFGDGTERKRLQSAFYVFCAITESDSWEFSPEWDKLWTLDGLESALADAWEYACDVRWGNTRRYQEEAVEFRSLSSECEGAYLMRE